MCTRAIQAIVIIIAIDVRFISGGRIHISCVTQALLNDHGNFVTEFRGIIDVKVTYLALCMCLFL